MRAPFVVLALFAASCASSGSTSTPARATETVRIQGVGGSLNMSGSSSTTAVTTVALPIDQVWGAMPAVYDSLGIPVTTLDPATRTIGNTELKLRRQLGKTALSKYLDCGNTQMGPSADSYEVYLSVTTRLKSGESGATSVESTVDATARPVQFAQAPSRCASRGELEKRVATLAAALSAQAKR